jgi:hypothetical protein
MGEGVYSSLISSIRKITRESDGKVNYLLIFALFIPTGRREKGCAAHEQGKVPFQQTFTDI